MPATDRLASLFFHAPNTVYRIESTKILYSPETSDTVSADPKSIFRTRTCGPVDRIEDYGFGAIVSGNARKGDGKMTGAKAKSMADYIFTRFKSENRVFVTGDGQAFLDGMHAQNHSVNNGTKRELKIFDFLRESEDKKEGEKDTDKDKKQ